MKKYNGTTWVDTTLRQYKTATADIEPTIYTDGTAITSYTIKGNEEHTGTPSPSNPVEVNGVGERTENLWNKYNIIELTVGTRYGMYLTTGKYYSILNETDNNMLFFGDDGNTRLNACLAHSTATLYMPYNYSNVGLYMPYNDVSLGNVTVVEGQTVPSSYIPYGYKLPISNGQQTIDIYIGDLPLLKSLDGTAVDEISNGTLTRRVDSDGSVLPTPTTTQITMPSIPTTEGANSITVDTTVQPSEFTATWTGWHDSSVKEWDGSDWQ